MRTSLLVTLFMLLFLTGCGRMISSGIPQALNTDTLLKTAGTSQGITLSPGSNGAAADNRSVQTDRRLYATTSSGTGGQLMTSYQKEIERTITSMGGSINGRGTSGSPNDLKDFSFTYTWGRNKGLIEVISFTSTNSEVQVVMFCYEHR